ncbi:unnamed protein product [Urochloa humidicola]
MLNLYTRHQLHASSVDGEENADANVIGYNPFYASAVICVSIFLFCVLAASVSVWKALAIIPAVAALLLGLAGCFAPKGWFRPSDDGRGASAELVVITVMAGAAAGCVVCSVCLEDVNDGEMVRQVPACRHIFHVECIDMWLHSHRTCPMCRCVVSPPSRVSTPKAAAELAPELPDDHDELPPV